MAFTPNTEKMETHTGGDITPETEVIPEGEQPCKLVGYIEIGKHQLKKSPKYGGGLKAPEMGIVLIFEFGTAKYAGSFPLTLSTCREFKENEFFDWIGVSEKLAAGELGMTYAMKTTYMKALSALNAASAKEFKNLREAVGEIFLADIHHTENKKNPALPYANMSITGNTTKGYKALANPVITSSRTGKVLEDLTEDYPEAPLREYAVFEWEEPTEAAWKALTKWHKALIKKAINYDGSPIQAILLGNPDLDMPVEDKSELDPNEGEQPKPAEGRETPSSLNTDAGGL